MNPKHTHDVDKQHSYKSCALFGIYLGLTVITIGCQSTTLTSPTAHGALATDVNDATKQELIAIAHALGALDTGKDAKNDAIIALIKETLGPQSAYLRYQVVPEGQNPATLIVRVGDKMGPNWDPTVFGIGFSGHTDVVPPEATGWLTDPFSFVEKDGHLFGRGAVDMKTQIASYILMTKRVLKWIEANRKGCEKLGFHIALILPWGEEIGSKGMAETRNAWDYASWEALPPNVMIGEPTELQPLHGTKGHLTGYFSFEGPGQDATISDVSAEEKQALATIALYDLQTENKRTATQDNKDLFPSAPIIVYNPITDFTLQNAPFWYRALNKRPEDVHLGVRVRKVEGKTFAVMLEEMKVQVLKAMEQAYATPSFDFQEEEKLLGEVDWHTFEENDQALTGYFAFHGAGGHSSRMVKGSAEEQQARAAIALLAWQRSYLQDSTLKVSATDPPIINLVSDFNLADEYHQNRPLDEIPASVQLGVGVRVLPIQGQEGNEAEPAVAAMQAAMLAVLPQGTALPWQQMGFNPPFVVNRAHPFVTHLVDLTGNAAGTESYATDAGNLLQVLRALHADPSVVILGPGNIDFAHLPNEKIPLMEVWQYLHLQQALLSERIRGFDAHLN